MVGEFTLQTDSGHESQIIVIPEFSGSQQYQSYRKITVMKVSGRTQGDDCLHTGIGPDSPGPDFGTLPLHFFTI